MKASRISCIVMCAIVAADCGFAAAAEVMFRANVEGITLEGKPLSWNSQQMLLLGRDGKLYDFNPKLAKDAKKTSPSYVAYTAAEMKKRLQHEFENRSEVSTTRHYLVVHPRGDGDVWANR